MHGGEEVEQGHVTQLTPLPLRLVGPRLFLYDIRPANPHAPRSR